MIGEPVDPIYILHQLRLPCMDAYKCIYIFDSISQFLQAPCSRERGALLSVRSLWCGYGTFKMRGGYETCIHSPPLGAVQFKRDSRSHAETVERSMFCIHTGYAAGGLSVLVRKREPGWLRHHRPSLEVNLGSWEQLK